jgi:hypothetical protein
MNNLERAEHVFWHKLNATKTPLSVRDAGADRPFWYLKARIFQVKILEHNIHHKVEFWSLRWNSLNT